MLRSCLTGPTSLEMSGYAFIGTSERLFRLDYWARSEATMHPETLFNASGKLAEFQKKWFGAQMELPATLPATE